MKNFIVWLTAITLYLIYSALACFCPSVRAANIIKGLLHVAICAVLGYGLGQAIAGLIV